MGQKRSDHYNWFNTSKQGGPKKSGKDTLKSIWKVIKIFTYVALFALSLAGCVQSFVIQSDTKTGAGLEFYKSEDQVAPHALTIEETNKIYEKGESSQKVLTISKDNYWLRDDQVLKAIHIQEPNLGQWRSKTQSFRVVDQGNNPLNNQLIAQGVDNKYYIVNDKDSSYSLHSERTTKLNFMYVKPTAVSEDITQLLKPGSKWTGNEVIGNTASNPYNSTQQDTLTLGLVFDNYTKKGIPDNSNFSTFAQNNDAKFSLDSYAYLANYYLNLKNMPNVVAGNPLSDQDRSWIENYIAISSITGWGYQVDKNSNKDPLKQVGYFAYIDSQLSFQAIKEQRPIFSWAGSWNLGPFYALFVYPLSWLTNIMMAAMPQMAGWEAIIAILIIVLIVRSLAYALSFKSTLQTVKQQEVQGKVAVINAKYEPYKGNKQMDRRKQQEVQELYKKEGISMFGAFGQILITMPLFLAMWRVIGSTPSLKSTYWLGINFASTSYQELFKGSWQYLPLMIVTAVIQALQAITPRLFTKRREKNRVNIYQKQAMKKSNKTQNIMVGVFIFMSLVLSAGLQVYWFFTGLYAIMQNTINHYVIKYQSKNRKVKAEY